MSSIPVPQLVHVPNVSKVEQPYPADYAEIVTARLLTRGETAELSTPVHYDPWSINDAVGWSSCLRRADTSVTLVILAAGRVSGTLAPAPVGYCETATYAPIARAALVVE